MIMHKIDLENYRESWRNEPGLNDWVLSDNEISNFIKSSSKSIDKFLGKGLIFDIAYKSILILALIVLFYMASGKIYFYYLSTICALIIMIGLGWQIFVLSKLKAKSIVKMNYNILEKLNIIIGLYHKYFTSSIYVMALSNSMLFIVGSEYYLFVKYQIPPIFQLDDYMVLCIGVLMSFGISAIFQTAFYKFRINQLEDCTRELLHYTLSKERLDAFYFQRKTRNILMGVFFIIGLVFLLFLFLNYQ